MNMLSAFPHDRLQWARQLALLLTLALAACAGKDAGDLYAGRAARPDNQAAIASIQGKETVWSGKDLAIHYMALPGAAGTMDINGFVEFEYNLGKYDLINHFRVYIHFIDAQGIILETRLLWNVAANADATLVRWTFQRQWPLPPGAQAIGFSYMGTLSGIGSTEKGVGSGAGWSVKELP
jgi:hypothetical protein